MQSDYCDVFLADRIEEQISPDCGVFVPMLAKTDVSDERFIFRTENGSQIMRSRRCVTWNSLPEETIQKMADTYTEGSEEDLYLAAKIFKEKTVNVLYSAGFERMIQYAIRNLKNGITSVDLRCSKQCCDQEKPSEIRLLRSGQQTV